MKKRHWLKRRANIKVLEDILEVRLDMAAEIIF